MVLEDSYFDENSFISDVKSKAFHVNVVQKAIDEIKNSELQKVVISRKETIDLSNFDLVKIYKKLLKS